MIRLESAGAARALLDGYDREAGTWSFPQAGDFWEAVAEARRRGLTGRGGRVAVIDSAFDLGIGRLAEAAGGRPRMKARPGEPTDHGTAVALLVLAVAPDARLDLYEVMLGGVVDQFAVRDALREVARSEAEVVCLSLGQDVVWEKLDRGGAGARERTGDGLADLLRAPPAPWRVAECPLRACLCAEARTLAAQGHQVFAACGNDSDFVACPAIEDAVASIGFATERRARTSGSEVAWLDWPSYSQSMIQRLLIVQPKGVLGSSFATPLAAGAAALDGARAPLHAMLDAVDWAGRGEVALQSLQVSKEPDRDLEEAMFEVFLRSSKVYPHMEGLLGGDHWCFWCGFLSGSMLVNPGMAFRGLGRVDLAESYLRAARRVAPWSPHAAANLGATLVTMARHGLKGREALEEALGLYDLALLRLPDHGGCKATRDEIAEKLRA